MKKINNHDFFEAKERLGLLTVGDPGADKLSVNDTFLISAARKLDNKIKDHPELKSKLIKIRSGLRKARRALNRARALRPTKKHTIQTGVKTSITDIIREIRFATVKDPDVSIIIPAFNKANFTASCLLSISNRIPQSPSYEVILVDNGSTDDTILFKSIKNLVYVENSENLGFVGGCNSGLTRAKGKYVIYLNNDAEVTEGWLSTLYDTITSDSSIGIVGSKIIYPNGVLQEAGGIIFSDASGLNYGKFDQESAYQYNYVRDVDYCSGASIIISRELMNKFSGFDILYQPAYYEDTDLSFKVRKEGLRVVYQPRSIIYHIEGGTAGTNTNIGFKKFQEINKEKFLKRWGNELKHSHVNEKNWYLGRDRSGDKLALIIEEAVPAPDKDSGSVRMIGIIKGLQSLGYKVTFWPNNLKPIQPYTENLQQLGVEVVYGNINFMQFARLYGHYYDTVIMSRPEICSRYINICRTLFTNATLIYDTVDLHYVRLARQAEIEKADAERLNEQSKWYEVLEKGLMERVDATIVVSDKEVDILKKEGIDAPLMIVSNIHTVDLKSYEFDYDERKDIVFVGNYAHLPNRDAVKWFINDIYPLVKAKLPNVKLHVVGANMPESLHKVIQGDGIIARGFISDEELIKLLRSSRVFVAPLRYGAGVKGKIGQAIEHGLPVVTTSIGAEGMFLKQDVSCVEANDAEAFAEGIHHLYSDKKFWKEIQKNAQTSLEKNFSIDSAMRNLSKLLKNK